MDWSLGHQRHPAPSHVPHIQRNLLRSPRCLCVVVWFIRACLAALMNQQNTREVIRHSPKHNGSQWLGDCCAVYIYFGEHLEKSSKRVFFRLCLAALPLLLCLTAHVFACMRYLCPLVILSKHDARLDSLPSSTTNRYFVKTHVCLHRQTTGLPNDEFFQNKITSLLVGQFRDLKTCCEQIGVNNITLSHSSARCS